VLNSTRYPQANGQIERVNRAILPLLNLSTIDQCNWDTKMRKVDRHLNLAIYKTTSKTPCEALYGYQSRYQGRALHYYWAEPKTKGQNRRNNMPRYVNQYSRYYVKNIWNFNTIDDTTMVYRVHFDIGEVVFMLRQPVPRQSTKLQSKYREHAAANYIGPSDRHISSGWTSVRWYVNLRNDCLRITVHIVESTSRNAVRPGRWKRE